MTNCAQNSDAGRLQREGASRDDRASAALNPSSVPADAATVAQGVTFAQDYARLLNRFGPNDTVVGDWSSSFGSSPTVPLAVAASEDVAAYKASVRAWFAFLNELSNAANGAALRDQLGFLYASLGTLARALDDLERRLPEDSSLKGVLRNAIASQLAPAFARLIAYYRGGRSLGLVNDVAPPSLRILRHPVDKLSSTLASELSPLWSRGTPWSNYLAGIAADTSVYGAAGGLTPFTQINHCATHNLFRSIFETFLMTFARVVREATPAFERSLRDDAGHAPQYALFLAFLQLLERARTSGNSITQRHLDFYYRTILGLKEKPAQPSQVHLLAELVKTAASYELKRGQLLKAGKEASGKEQFFANDGELVVSKASVAVLKTLYVHGEEPFASGTKDPGRVYASPVAASSDGQGAPLLTPDQAWHPFFNKVYRDGALDAIAMPRATLGFVVASHYLWLSEGKRTITVTLHTKASPTQSDFKADVQCKLSAAKGWLVKSPDAFARKGSTLELSLVLEGGDEAIVPYDPALHQGAFDTDLPVLVVELLHAQSRPFAYAMLQDTQVSGLDLRVDVEGLRSFTLANDLGPIDAAKPFQPFGPSPLAGSSLIFGAKEIFQKQLSQLSVSIDWQVVPAAFGTNATAPKAFVDFLANGAWKEWSSVPMGITSGTPTIVLDKDLEGSVLDAADFAPAERFSTQARRGFVRLRLDGDIGQANFQSALLEYLRTTPPPKVVPQPPQPPVAASLTLGYTAQLALALDTSSPTEFERRRARFFHLAPFGSAEQHPYLHQGDSVPLLPQFRFARGATSQRSSAELYIGLANLAPPQSVALLFELVDGTANPLVQKPRPHLHYAYLSHDEWIAFDDTAVVDATDELLNAGIVTFAMPRQATRDNRLLPSGMHWIRVAVSEASDAVCQLQLVAAQAFKATFVERGNAREAPVSQLPAGTISKLAQADAALKRITQPFPSFGGRAEEAPLEFYQRVSERLRHKNRAIALWDYEHLILEAFPQIYRVKCLNHTQYEPAAESGDGPCSGGVYRELAPGHVTIVTLPQLQTQPQRDPLKPYTSLGLLRDIGTFLRKRTSCHATLHVANPQFEEVRVSFKVKLFAGCDESYQKQQLQQAIVRFLSPWAFSQEGSPSFGGQVFKAALVNFIEEQPCVDYLTDFQLFHDIPCVGAGAVDLEQVRGSRAISILVSAPASKHMISILNVAAQDAALAESCGCAP